MSDRGRYIKRCVKSNHGMLPSSFGDIARESARDQAGKSMFLQSIYMRHVLLNLLCVLQPLHPSLALGGRKHSVVTSLAAFEHIHHSHFATAVLPSWACTSL